MSRGDWRKKKATGRVLETGTPNRIPGGYLSNIFSEVGQFPPEQHRGGVYETDLRDPLNRNNTPKSALPFRIGGSLPM
jgi:hypothetical protein